MATKKCINGHIYDPNVYGDNCPFCPSGSTINFEGETRVNGGDETVETIGGTRPTVSVTPEEDFGSGTVIRHIDSGATNAGIDNNKRIVALLVSYDTNPLGEVYKIYEGRNMVGRKANVDISIKGDSQVSSEHLVILYREAEGVFWAIDNNSSNGTYVNGAFENKAQLKTNDVITIGSTRLIFIAVPKLPAK